MHDLIVQTRYCSKKVFNALVDYDKESNTFTFFDSNGVIIFLTNTLKCVTVNNKLFTKSQFIEFIKHEES
jgi:hypothetical protein